MRAISWVAELCCSTALAIAEAMFEIWPMVPPISLMAATDSWVATCMPVMCDEISSVAFAVWLASDFTSVATTISDAVAQQSTATQEIARSVQSVAQGTQEAAANVMQVNRGATETGSASEEVLSSARSLSTESTRLREQLDRFMANIRAA